VPEAPQPRLRRGEFATAAWALALLVVMFAAKWFGVDNIPGKAPTTVSAVDAWNGLSALRWLMLATILLVLGSVALHLSQGGHGSQTDTSLAVAVAATFVAVGLIYRVLIALPQAQAIVDQKLGALVGLVCALAMAASAWQARRAVLAAARTPVVRHRRLRSGVGRPLTPGGERAAGEAELAARPAGEAEVGAGSTATAAGAPAGGEPPAGGAAPVPTEAAAPDGADAPASREAAVPDQAPAPAAPVAPAASAAPPAPSARRGRRSRPRPT
jgi:hypothetical protein